MVKKIFICKPEGIGYDEIPSLAGENLSVDFQDLTASEIALRLEAPGGIRYLEALGDETALVPLCKRLCYSPGRIPCALRITSAQCFTFSKRSGPI